MDRTGTDSSIVVAVSILGTSEVTLRQRLQLISALRTNVEKIIGGSFEARWICEQRSGYLHISGLQIKRNSSADIDNWRSPIIRTEEDQLK